MSSATSTWRWRMQQAAASTGRHFPAPTPFYLSRAVLILMLVTTSLGGAIAQGIIDCQPCSASSECASGVCGDPALNTDDQLTCAPSDPSTPCLIAVPSTIRGSTGDCAACSDDEDCKSGLCSFQGTVGFCISSDSTCVDGRAVPVGPAPSPTATLPTPSPAAAPAVGIPAPETSGTQEDDSDAPVRSFPFPNTSLSPSSAAPQVSPQTPSTPTSQPDNSSPAGGPLAAVAEVTDPPPTSSDSPVTTSTPSGTPTPSGAHKRQAQVGTVGFLAAAAGAAALLLAR